eukprot:CFRG7965T1
MKAPVRCAIAVTFAVAMTPAVVDADVGACNNMNGKLEIVIKDGSLKPDSSLNTLEFKTMVNNVEWMRTEPLYTENGFAWNTSGVVHRYDCASIYFELFEDGNFDNDRLDCPLTEEQIAAALNVNSSTVVPCGDKGTLNVDLKLTPWSKYRDVDRLLVPDVYFPPRFCSNVTLYNDAHFDAADFPNTGGDDLWNRMYAEIKKAENFIYIAGWSVYPLLRMIRSPTPKETLETLLKEKAKEGVQVIVMVWGNTVPVIKTYDRMVEEAFKDSDVIAIRATRRVPNTDEASSLADISFTHHQKTVVLDSGGELVGYVGGIDLTIGRYDDQIHPLFGREPNVENDDYYQSTISDPNPLTDPREPLHDIHSRNTNEGAVDTFLNFQERFYKEVEENTKNAAGTLYNYTLLPSLAACSNGSDWTTQTVRSIDVNSFIPNPEWATPQTMSTIGTGRYDVDQSVHNAYIHHIMSAKKFIYLENQYFGGSAQYWATPGTTPQNEVAISLATRIIEAVNADEEFCVYITTPLFPEGISDSITTQEMLYWQSQTSDMMTRKITEALNTKGSNKTLSDYLQFFWPGIRQFNPALQQDAAEMIYVHSKHLIVDDTISIIGSANINDRSMLGNRDTEIAIIAHEPDKVRSANGTLPQGKVYEHRKRLWTEHAGPEVWAKCASNPCSPDCNLALKSLAQSNLDLFWEDLSVRQNLTYHLVRMPYDISSDTGAITAIPGKENIPHQTGSMLGKYSAVLPDILTTRRRDKPVGRQ